MGLSLFTVLTVAGAVAATTGTTTARVAVADPPPAAVPVTYDEAAELSDLRSAHQRASRDRRTAERAAEQAARDAAAAAARAADEAAKTKAKAKTRTAPAKPRRAESAPNRPAPATPRARRSHAAPPPQTAAAPPAGGSASTVISFALAQVGKPYIWASAGPRGFDCSGLLVAAFGRVGLRLPHQSGAIAVLGRAVPRGQWAPGDVLYWPGHVALYLGGGKMVAAPGRGRHITVQAVYGSPGARRLL